MAARLIDVRHIWLLAVLLLWHPLSSADPGCQDSKLISGKLVTDICWDCLFPLRVAGQSLGGAGTGHVPEGAVTNPFCSCPDSMGIPFPGFTMSMWEPARLIEFQRVPGCSSVLGGSRLPFDRSFQGTHGNGDFDGGDGLFVHYHYYAFPLLSILELFVNRTCSADGYMDLDIMYMSELDPTWNNSELAYFATPEASAVANPIASAACAMDAVASTAGRPLQTMFWCAGSWGNLYPFSGHRVGGGGIIRESSLLKAKVIASLHRRGQSWRTIGEETLCRGKYEPTLPKTQYKFTLVHPVPETQRAHVLGESTLVWGTNKTIPAIGQDPIYLIWRWNDCCNTYDGSN